jgi:hypothetical protein
MTLAARPMLDRHHECFTPPAANCTLWRYMDLTKLLSLLESRTLYFPRADQFNDPYEGAWSRAGVEMLRASSKNDQLPPTLVDQLLASSERVRQTMYISCWFASEHESAAMWKLYLQSPEGIAIRTDHDALAAALERSPLRARTTLVRYIDYDKVPIPFVNLFFPFVHKRMSFAHETELRAIIWSDEDVNITQIPAGSTAVTVDVVLEELIKAVHVSPAAPQWFGELTEQLLRRYGLAVPVVRSSLYDRPSY